MRNFNGVLKEKTRRPRRGRSRRIGESEQINFAWIVFTGLQIGYGEKDIRHLYFGKWADLLEEYKKMHNMKMNRMVFAERKVTSLMDL